MNISLILPTYGHRFPLAAPYLMANLETQGHRAHLHFFDRKEFKRNNSQPANFSLMETLLSNSCDVVAIGCMVDLLPYFLFSLRQWKQKFPGKTVILGGAGPSEFAEEIIRDFPEIDFVVKDKDPAILSLLLTALESHRDLAGIAGVVSKNSHGIVYTPAVGPCFDHFFYPNAQPFQLDRFRNFSLVTVEGCPYRCTFCSSKPFLDGKLRYRDLAQVMDELLWIKKHRGNIPHVSIVDEAFVTDKKRVSAFCDMLNRSGLNIKWGCYGRANCLDEAMMREMKAAGCTGVFLGIESGADEVLKQIKKDFTIQHAVKTMLTAAKYFNRVTASFIWGFPFESFENFNHTLMTVLYLHQKGIHTNLKLLYPVKESAIYSQYKHLLQFSERGRNTGHMFLSSEHAAFVEFVKSHLDIFPRYSIYMHPGFQAKADLLERKSIPGLFIPDDDVNGVV